MKSIEYYCSTYFDPRIAQELTAPQYFLRKINAAEQTIKDLLEVGIESRDGHRIFKISKAIKDWKRLYDEIYGKEWNEEWNQ